MDATAIHEAIKAQPFRPFSLRLADNRQILVEHPDFIFVTPSGRRVIVEQTDASMSILEPLLIVSIEFSAPTIKPDNASNGNGEDVST